MPKSKSSILLHSQDKNKSNPNANVYIKSDCELINYELPKFILDDNVKQKVILKAIIFD